MNQKDLIQQLNVYRKEHKVFQRSIEQRSEKFQSITYDGPPFASGSPHFGHGITSSMKDCILRYKTMRGYKVNRDRGWDCHGLPAEKAVEKALGLDGKKDIEEKLGVGRFVEECRKYVTNLSGERETFVDNLGRRADMEHAYFTMDLDYMESVIRVFQNMYSQNLVYKGFNVQWMCPSCATTLANNEVNEGYKDRQDPAITIKFKIQQADFKTKGEHEITEDGLAHTVKAIIRNEKGGILTFFDTRWDFWTLPGGKVDKGEDFETALTRELHEELGIKVVNANYLGARKYVGKTRVIAHYFDVTISGTPKIKENNKHTELKYVEIIESDNDLKFAVKIDDIIIDDTNELISRFLSFYTIHTVLPYTKEFGKEMATADVNVLAWTTTPWTLPSNMFLAVGNHIRYIMVFDKTSKEYYILAENLIKQYYKNPDEYILINILQGENLVGIGYEPLFPHINNSKIDKKYKEQFFKIIAGEFVSTEDGTGIVHIAPAFGMDDYNIVAEFLPRDDSKNRLFLPVNDYGEFTDEVPEWKGIRVYEANKEIIQRLKEEKKLIGQKSYEHSYPHCRRCDTPLISKALTSRFIKEQELANITVPHAEEIGFVPEAVKKRFTDVLKSAPDWNLARNRYRGSPLPIRENTKKPEDIIVCGTLEEIYQGTRTGSQNITKHVFLRHEETDYNPTYKHDSYGKAKLDEKGKKTAIKLAKQLKKLKKDDMIIVVSPLHRTMETITPFLTATLGTEVVTAIENKYAEAQKIYQELWTKKEIQAYIKNPDTQKLFQLHEKVYMDFRITDIMVPEWQDVDLLSGGTTKQPTDVKLTPEGECMDDVQARIAAYVENISDLFKSKTIITVTHKDSVVFMHHTFKYFDYITKKHDHLVTNGQMFIRYRDNERKMEMDLHKPYVDSYRFKKGAKEYRRIPEVMDCWFESGSMPFGQSGYTSTHSTKPLIYPADFIIEGLDQTRGWFRALSVVGNAVMKKNSFNNVLINGMILAEDGKKMAKKLKNYPDPEYLFYRYGSDAYRLYMLSSPGVRAEPVKFSEKAVDQIYKDFTASILNAYKFFETYATVDKRSTTNTSIYYMRHGEATGKDIADGLTEEGLHAMKDEHFIEKVLRIDPDIIYTSPSRRTMQTAEEVAKIIKLYRNKKVKIKVDERLRVQEKSDVAGLYKSILKKGAGETVLLISHDVNFRSFRPTLCTTEASLYKLDSIKLPTYAINNELDKWILAELHNLGIQLEQEMEKYSLDTSTKLVLGFIEKLNNRFIRRSRRRFRASGMDQDKNSAFSTLFEVLQSYLKICAPFAPFISEHIYLELQKFTKQGKREGDSIHLKHLPLYSQQYIDKQLLEETEIVRRVISLGLFIRSKNKMAVKQPLAKMQIRL